MTWDHKYIKDRCSYYMGYEAGLITAKKEYIDILTKTMANSFDSFMDREIKMYNNLAWNLIKEENLKKEAAQ